MEPQRLLWAWGTTREQLCFCRLHRLKTEAGYRIWDKDATENGMAKEGWI